LFSMCLVFECLPGLALNEVAPSLSPSMSVTGCDQASSLHKPCSHRMSFAASDMATYSASQVLIALISCFLEAYEITCPSSIVA
ncbi:hypothetical protein PHYSODRAFT_525394, partial [Phytophthora sojae]